MTTQRIAQLDIRSNPNLLINSDLGVNQRGSGQDTASTFYPADRWRVRGTNGVGGTLTYSIPRGANGKTNVLKLDHTAAVSYAYVSQRVEAYIPANFYGDMTCSFNTNFDSSATIQVGAYWYEVGNSVSVDSILTPTKISGAGEQSHEFSFEVPTIPSYDSAKEYYLELFIFYGTSSSPVLNGSYRFDSIKLEKGPLATPYESEKREEAISRCQRFFHRIPFTANPFGEGFPITTAKINTYHMRDYVPSDVTLKAYNGTVVTSGVNNPVSFTWSSVGNPNNYAQVFTSSQMTNFFEGSGRKEFDVYLGGYSGAQMQSPVGFVEIDAEL